MKVVWYGNNKLTLRSSSKSTAAQRNLVPSCVASSPRPSSESFQLVEVELQLHRASSLLKPNTVALKSGSALFYLLNYCNDKILQVKNKSLKLEALGCFSMRAHKTSSSAQINAVYM